MSPRLSATLPRSNRGSILLVAMILTILIAMSLGSYLSLSRSNMVISNRALYNSAAMNLAENGLEEGMYSINKKVAEPTYDWSGWTNDGVNAWRKLTGYTFDQNATGETRVIVYNYLGSAAPKIVARSSIRLANQNQPIEKWVEVQLRKTSRYANGLVAKESLKFSGNNASVDSWNSEKNDDGSARGSPVGYSSSVKHDKGTAGSISVAVDAVLVQNADIWGWVKTGGSAPVVGSNGTIGPFGTATGTVVPSRVQTDFTMPIEIKPTITTGTTLPAIGNGDLPKTLGTSGSTNIYRIPSITSSGNSSKVLTIDGNVTIVLTGGSAGTEVLGLSGQSSIEITSGSSLTIYAEGDINITGNGVANANLQPKSFTVIATSTSTLTTQKVDIKGNGELKAVVDAPNAAVKIVGNGDVSGSVLGKTIELTGNAAFHYDESLADLGSGNPYRISKWVELTAAGSRDLYRSNLNF